MRGKSCGREHVSCNARCPSHRLPSVCNVGTWWAQLFIAFGITLETPDPRVRVVCQCTQAYSGLLRFTHGYLGLLRLPQASSGLLRVTYGYSGLLRVTRECNGCAARPTTNGRCFIVPVGNTAAGVLRCLAHRCWACNRAWLRFKGWHCFAAPYHRLPCPMIRLL